MPFLDGIATSVHGIVLPDGVAVLRPVELVTLRRGHELVYAGCSTYWDPPTAVREEMRAAARRVGEQLRADVEFRGAFTLDGVATRDGFRPTELNPRFGAGLMIITHGIDRPADAACSTSSSPAARWASPPTGWSGSCSPPPTSTAPVRRRSCTSPTPEPLEGRGLVYDDGSWRWAGDGEQPDGVGIVGRRLRPAVPSHRAADRRVARAAGRWRSGASTTR